MTGFAFRPYNPLVLVSVLTGLVVVFAGPALAAKPEIYTGWNGLAVGGYDTVAYYIEGEPVKGSTMFELEFRGATWRFSSEENLHTFEADPDSYAPRYGGYCAWAVANGYLAKGNPKYWTIHDGALYLNYSKGVQRDWLEDIEGFVAKADVNWPGVLNE